MDQNLQVVVGGIEESRLPEEEIIFSVGIPSDYESLSGAFKSKIF